MDDAGVRGNHAEVVKAALAPAEKRVALAVALELELGVAHEGLWGTKDVDLHRVVDHQLPGDQWVDPFGVAAHVAHRVAHRRQVDDRRDPREVLHQYASRHEGDLVAGLGLGVPPSQRLDVLPADGLPVLVPEQVLQQHLEGEREPLDVVGGLQGVQSVDVQ